MLKIIITIIVIASISFLFYQFKTEDVVSDKFVFSGYEWTVRSWDGGPGPNKWSDQNVWLDQDKNLHLKITRDQKEWKCAELATTNELGDGVYEFHVIGRVDNLHQNVVLGLFQYPGFELDGLHEIGIELSKWGWDNPKNIIYTAFSTHTPYEKQMHEDRLSLNGEYTTHRIQRKDGEITFSSFHGHQQYPQQDYLISSWTAHNGSARPMPVHINLWLYDGKAPDQEVEIIISDFNYYPL